tara:strand:+ start:931 stop:1887 length:957 start_codon:yes stop_codon:yes gene_type:complete
MATKVNPVTGALDYYEQALPPFRNKLINGNFDIWQRDTNQTSSGYGSVDRWGPIHAGSSKTVSQQSFTNGQTDVPGNPRYYFRHVVTSSAGAANYVLVYQPIESVRTLAGKVSTLSFYAKADSSKNIATEITQWFGTGGSPSSWNTGNEVTTHNLTNAWQKFTVTVTIPSISGKTIGTNNDDYLGLYFHFDAGSDYNSRTNSLGQQSGTFDIAQVQIEEGTSATPFEHRPIGTELSLCQRYYQDNVPSFAVSRHNDNHLHGSGFFKVTMRATPSASLAYNQYGQTSSIQSISKEYYVSSASGNNANSLHVRYNMSAEL